MQKTTGEKNLISFPGHCFRIQTEGPEELTKPSDTKSVRRSSSDPGSSDFLSESDNFTQTLGMQPVNCTDYSVIQLI
jgi:hypothetical protein